MPRITTSLISAWLCGTAFGGVTQLNGDLPEPLDRAAEPNNTARLIGDTKTTWHSTTSSIDVGLNGYTLELNTGDGNAQTYRGAMTGPGKLVLLVGRHDAGWWQSGDLRISGDTANTPTRVLIRRGSVNLDKPVGVDALAGAITLGDASSDNRVVLVWNADEQIHDNASVTSAATPFEWRMRGHSETLDRLALHGRGTIDLGAGPSRVRFADSSQTAWGEHSSLLIRNWEGRDTNRVVFGGDGLGLTPEQIACIGLIDPAGLAPGLYRSRLGENKHLIPSQKVEPVNPPFDLSETARRARERLYRVDGRAKLTGVETPLTDNTTISLFGDSITWQDGYAALIRDAINTGVGTRGKTIRVVNRGINGGGVTQVRDGSEDSAFPGSSAQKPFAQMIAADRADIAVVFIGINDLWWRETSERDFQSALKDIAVQAKDAGTRLVFASPTVRFEKPDGSNENDNAIDRFTRAMREVAEDQGVGFIDLRAAYLAYLRNHNAQLQLDGSLIFKRSGVLTHDGVHPTAEGNALLADLISRGIVRAASAADRSCRAADAEASPRALAAVSIGRARSRTHRPPSDSPPLPAEASPSSRPAYHTNGPVHHD